MSDNNKILEKSIKNLRENLDSLLMDKFITTTTVYKILHRSRDKDYSIHRSVNKRFKCLEYGLKRLAKIEILLEEKLKKQAKRYNKKYPGEMIHFGIKRLPLMTFLENYMP